MFFFEHEDGRVMLSYMAAKTFTTKEKVMQIPFPVPSGYAPLKPLSANNRTAIRLYREYLAQPTISAERPDQTQQSQEKRPQEDEDPDAKYEPMLRGAFSTRPGREDYDKVEGELL